jgi:hypothetical protein
LGAAAGAKKVFGVVLLTVEGLSLNSPVEFLYGSDLLAPDGILRLEAPGPPVPEEEIIAAKRIGLGVKAEEWAERPWRFYREGSIFITPG